MYVQLSMFGLALLPYTNELRNLAPKWGIGNRIFLDKNKARVFQRRLLAGKVFIDKRLHQIRHLKRHCNTIKFVIKGLYLSRFRPL